MSENTNLSWRAEMFRRRPTTSSSDSQKPSPDNQIGKPSPSPTNQTRREDVRVGNYTAYNPILREYDTSPIFITWLKRMKTLRIILNEVARKEYKARLIGNDDVVILASNPEKYNAIVEILKKKNIQFVRNQFLPERDGLFKVVMRGFEYTASINKIRLALNDLGHKVIRMAIVISKKGEPQPFFVIKLEARENNAQIFAVRRLANTEVSFESPYQANWLDFYTKCYRCQEFGHRERYCAQLICALCSESHDTFDCPLNLKMVHMKCLICGRPHPPNFRCALVRRVEENRDKKEEKNDTPPPVTFDNYPLMPAATAPQYQRPVPKEPETSFINPQLTYAQVARIPAKTPPKPNYSRPNYNAKKDPL